MKQKGSPGLMEQIKSNQIVYNTSISDLKDQLEQIFGTKLPEEKEVFKQKRKSPFL